MFSVFPEWVLLLVFICIVTFLCTCLLGRQQGSVSLRAVLQKISCIQSQNGGKKDMAPIPKKEQGTYSGQHVSLQDLSSSSESESFGSIFSMKAGAALGYIKDQSDSKKYGLLLEELKKAKARYDRILYVAHQGIWEWDKSTRRLIFSPQSYRLLGYDESEEFLEQEEWLPHFFQEDYEEIVTKVDSLTPEQPFFESEFRCRDKNGPFFWVLCRGTGVFENGQLVRILGSFTDINRTKRNELVFQVLYKVSMASYLDTGIYNYMHSVCEAVSLYDGVQEFYVALWIPETNTFEFIYDTNTSDHAQLDDCQYLEDNDITRVPGLSGHVIRRGETQIFTKDSEEMVDCLGDPTECWMGSPIKLGGRTVGLVTIQNTEDKDVFSHKDAFLLEAVAEQIARAIEHDKVHNKLLYQASHDNLTGLVNREYFLDLGARLLRKKVSGIEKASLLMLDLNRFKQINDSLGHAVGDRVLVEIAGRIQSLLRQNDTLGRIGGDEFAILLEKSGEASNVVAVAKRIIEEVRKGVPIDDRMVMTGISIGVVTDITGYDDIHRVLRDADLAMYEAKHNSSSHFRVFNQILHGQMEERIEIDSVLTNEFCEDEFVVVYQPLVDLKKQKIAGFEALVRWHSTRLGTVFPDQFLPVAEDNGVIAKIDMAVLAKVCRDLRAWQEKSAEFNEISISVNISQYEFIDAHLAQKIIQQIKNHGLSPASITIEVTETALMENIQAGKEILRELREAGISIHIDDFGTGYSSLAHLADLPFDALKIDRSFLQHAFDSAQHLTVLETLVKMSDSLEIPAIAEGIETMELLELVDTFGCEYGQGYFFSKPMPGENVLAYCQGFKFVSDEKQMVA